ncbi:MAG: F0F1 ATP synthase subunit epsilon [Pseudomonadales bacterium]|jgi:F-type H+-transporting ATPase subunit epsilon
MRLLVTTPTAVVVDAPDVRYLRAEDETGAFGILPGHADFLTVLAISVITWRNAGGDDHHVAVRGGVLTVRDGQDVDVATREAVGEDTLERLGDAVLARFREEAEAETESRVSTARLHLAAIRQLQRYLESGRQSPPVGAPPDLESGVARRIPPGEGEAP